MHKNLQNYFKLMRLDKVVGIYLVLWPCLWGVAIAAKTNFPYMIYVLMVIGAVIMRSAGCVINDIIDRKIDAKVVRTKNRPLASGAINLYQACILLICLLLIGLLILLTFNYVTILLGIFIVIPICIYPLMKRITYWPQVFLAFVINWGLFIGATAVYAEITYQAIILYLACVCWTIGYDTIYAHQDKEDDILIGVKSTALKFGSNTKKYLCVFYGLTSLLLWHAGVYMELGVGYYIFLILGVLQLIWQIYSLDLNNPYDCLIKFKSNVLFGLIILTGILLNYYFY